MKARAYCSRDHSLGEKIAGVFFSFVLAFSLMPSTALAASSDTGTAQSQAVEAQTSSESAASTDTQSASASEAASAAEGNGSGTLSVSSSASEQAAAEATTQSASDSTAAATTTTDDATASDTAAVWDGSIDVSWYNTTDTSFVISTPAQLAGLAAITTPKDMTTWTAGTHESLATTADGTAITQDNFAGKTVTLAADIDLGGASTTQQTWSPICNVNSPDGGGQGATNNTYDGCAWEGTFDGAGHVITNMHVNGGSVNFGGYQGFISALGKGAVVKNLGVTGDIYGRVAGGIAGITSFDSTSVDIASWPLIEQCWTNVAITSNGSSSRASGGIFGGERTYRSSVNIIDCYALGTVSGSINQSGGIAGITGGYIAGCYAVGSITGAYTGAIVSTQWMRGTANQDEMTPNGYFANNMAVQGMASNSISLNGVSTSYDTFYRYIDSTTDENNPILVASGVSSETATLKAADTSYYVKSASALASGMANLGDAYVADTTNINNGLPVLKWQTSGSTAKTDLSTGAIVAIPDQDYTGTGVYPDATVTLGDQTLTQGVDYLVSYANNVDSGTASVTVTGVGLYSGTLAGSFNIKTYDLSTAQIAPIPGQWRYGAPVEPSITVTDAEGNALTEGKDYQVSYSNNDEAGTGTVTISPVTAAQTGSAQAQFSIVDASTSLAGSGTQDDPYRIANRSDLQLLAHAVDTDDATYLGKCFLVTSDFSCAPGENEPENEPIGYKNSSTDGHGFYGTFDGGGHTITLALTAASQQHASARVGNALFAYVGNLAARGYTTPVVIKNLTVDGSVTNGYKLGLGSGEAAGVIATAEYCTLSMDNVTNKATITTDRGYAAGIASSVYAPVTFTKCVNEGAVTTGTSSVFAAGLVAYLYGVSSLPEAVDSFEDCSNSGTITSTAYKAAGLVGSASSSNSLVFTRCANTGNVTAQTTAAGIISSVNGSSAVKRNFTIDSTYNSGTITSERNSGGIVCSKPGMVERIQNCYNVGSVVCTLDSTYDYAGGIASDTRLFYNDLILSNVYNAGTVTSPENAGAIVGYFQNFKARMSAATIQVAGLYLEGSAPSGIGHVYLASSTYQAPTDDTKSYTSDQLKAAAPELGSAFAADAESINSGYPILFWQAGAQATDINAATADAIADQAATGSGIAPKVNLTYNGTQLVEGQDYWLSYADNVNVGTATVTVHGLGIYSGTTKALTFNITQGDFSTAKVKAVASQTYTGSAIEPSLTVTSASGATLVQGTDYEVAYTDNVNAGTATATLTGIGDWQGTLSTTFTIAPADLSTCTVAPIADQIATGQALTPELSVTNAEGVALTAGTDYTVAYSDNTAVGTATATLTGIGNYTGTATASFNIYAGSLDDATVSGVEDSYDYTGNAISIEPVVTVGGTTLTEGTDYEASITDADGTAVTSVVDKGTYTLTLTGIGAYTGSKSVTFDVGAYFTLYLQEGENGTPQEVKEYTKAEFEALADTSGTPVSGMYSRGTTWNVVSTGNYVTLEALLANAQLSDQWTNGASLEASAGDGFSKTATYEDMTAQSNFYPSFAGDASNPGDATSAPVVFGLDSYSQSMTTTAGDAQTANIAAQDAKNAPRLIYGISADQLTGGAAGSRYVSQVNAVTLIVPEPTYFTVYVQQGDDGTPQVAKEYTKSEFESLASSSTDPVSALFYMPSEGGWKVSTAATYVELSELFSDAGVSDVWKSGAKLSYGGDPAQGKMTLVFDYDTFNSMNMFYPAAQGTTNDETGGYTVPAVLALTEFSVNTQNMTAAQAQDYNVEHASTTNAPRMLMGVSKAGYESNSWTDETKGMRLWSNVEAVTIIVPTQSEAAKAVEDAIAALPEAADVTRADKSAIEAARAAYDALSADDQATITNYQKLVDDEAALSALAPTVERLAGDYAADTAAAIASRAFEGTTADTVVIARDDDYYDALSGAGLAGALNAPILLTRPNELSAACMGEIEALGATKAVVLGGTSAVSDDVVAALQAKGLSVERVWGENAYGTSLAVSQKLVDELGGSAQYAVAVNPTSFADAVSISGWAYRNKVPVMLQTWGDTAADRGFTDEALQILSGRTVIVCGGTAAVSDESVAGLATVRLGGETLYDTSLAIANWEIAQGGMSAADVSIASAAEPLKGVDALAASALAGRNGGVVLLAQSNPEYYPPVSTEGALGFLALHKDEIETVHVLGGEAAATPEFFDAIKAVMGL